MSPASAAAAVTVHPRVCGELPTAPTPPTPSNGSSPRVRGTRRTRPGGFARRRFIPACAGNSRAAECPACRAAVHPRVCGELRVRARARLQRRGSSPRVRGTLCPHRTGSAPEEVHPRVCGELEDERWRCWLRVRFIPACAGNSRRRSSAWRSRPVHPRVCGELTSRIQRTAPDSGSSPRVRGTPHRHRGRRDGDRFIPACAGNSPEQCLAGSIRPVHPRVCGELERVPDLLQQRRRFIPACAGNSAQCAPPRRPATVHPRVCGELAANEIAAAKGRGSSPRVRGTLGWRR